VEHRQEECLVVCPEPLEVLLPVVELVAQPLKKLINL
jgi:hypothetical protein